MNQVIASNLSLGSETYVALSAPNNCGTFIFNVDEATFTEDMKRDLSSVRLQIYNKAGNEYIPIKDRSVLWNMGKDQSLVIYGIPSSCYVGVNVIVDSTNKIVINEFPVSIEFDDSPVSSSVIFSEKTKQDIADMISGDLTDLGNKIDNNSEEIKQEISNITESIGQNVDSIKETIDNLSDEITENISGDLSDVKDISTEILNKVSGAQVDQNSLKPLVFGIDGDKVYISDTAEQDTTYIGRDANGLYVTK